MPVCLSIRGLLFADPSRVGWSPRISTTLLGFELSAPLSTPAENCTFMAGENCTPDDWVTNPKTPAPPGISCER